MIRRHFRDCAKPLTKFKVSYGWADRSGELEKTFGIVVKHHL